MSVDFEYQFPVIRGIQAQREYYVSMCPMRLLPKLFQFDEHELAPELRAQRQINKARIPELSRYITENMDNYVFSAITVSIDADIAFAPLVGDGKENRVGILKIPMSARFIINDGQHRRAAIDLALRNNPELCDETIAVVFFLDKGLERCQQMFADLNRYAIRPSTSLSILYDYRDEVARLVKSLIANSDIFRDVVELEKTSLAPRSRRLFTLSAIYHATNDLLSGLPEMSPDQASHLALEFWETVAMQMVDWNRVIRGEMAAGEVRADFIHTHGVVLQALARTGKALISRYPKSWKKRIVKLKSIDWRRANSAMWEGRALIGGQLSKAHQNITLTTNAIKSHLGLDLSIEEQRVENAFKQGVNGSAVANA
ncbi:MAG: DNA sulfur modification protein DndB [Candidatus Poribacteria bacterium]|nr:DNA sulfur modification protein DndB [Candidatus Poribacteria bacterium]MDE0286438.1 DNA sulfur modification protein DndB [Gammaproteobacteria bacterium]